MNNLLKKLKGYQKAPRGRFLLLKERRLTHEEFLLYELGVAISDWDSRHETYGVFKATNQEIAGILGWSSDTTALMHKNSLIKKGMFIVNDDGSISARGFEKWLLRKSKSSENESEVAKTQSGSSNREDNTSEIKEIQAQDNDYSLVSSKVDLSLSNEIPNESFSDEELENIIVDIDYQKSLLTADKGATYAN